MIGSSLPTALLRKYTFKEYTLRKYTLKNTLFFKKCTFKKHTFKKPHRPSSLNHGCGSSLEKVYNIQLAEDDDDDDGNGDNDDQH